MIRDGEWDWMGSANFTTDAWSIQDNSDFAKSTTSACKGAQWATIAKYLVAKWSIPYAPNAPHNFMHNKLAVIDDKLVVTGSFNFSETPPTTQRT